MYSNEYFISDPSDFPYINVLVIFNFESNINLNQFFISNTFALKDRV